MDCQSLPRQARQSVAEADVIVSVDSETGGIEEEEFGVGNTKSDRVCDRGKICSVRDVDLEHVDTEWEVDSAENFREIDDASEILGAARQRACAGSYDGGGMGGRSADQDEQNKSRQKQFSRHGNGLQKLRHSRPSTQWLTRFF